MFKISDTYFRFACVLQFIIFLVAAAPLKAETVNQSSDWLFNGAATQIADTYVLTSGSPRESGSAFLSQSICAREFKLSFELDLGGNVSPIGGDGVFISFLDTNGDPLFRVHTDSFFHGGEDPRYELDGNHVSVESVGAFYDVYGQSPVSGNTTFGPIVAGKAPFTMEGSGWFYGEIHRSGRVLKILITNGSAGLLLTAYLPSDMTQVVRPGFEGIAMNGMNEQKIRNISLNILNNENCTDYIPPLSVDEARSLLEETCGAVDSCPDESEYMSCVTQNTMQLLTDSRIQPVTAELLELEAQYGLSFCSGYEQCQDDTDVDAIKAASFDEGYTEGATDGDAAGYDRGLSEGDTAGYARGLSEGDAAGYTRGVADGTESGYTSGFSDGDMAGYTRGVTDGKKTGYDQGFSAGDAAGYARGMSDGTTSGYSSGLADGDAAGFSRGYTQGNNDGFAAGYASGMTDGSAAGYQTGYAEGLTDGETAGYTSGVTDGTALGDAAGYTRGLEEGEAAGYLVGFNDGEITGFNNGFVSGKETGLNEGFNAGYEQGLAEAPTCESSYLSFEEALAAVEERCSCDTYRHHGIRVVCSLISIKRLAREGQIQENMKRELFQTVARNKCS